MPCCTSTDPWPYGGPKCTTGAVHYHCLSPCRKFTEVHERYQHCLGVSQTYGDYPLDFGHMLELPCGQIHPLKPGASCALDEDCRPAAPGITRLPCDWESHTCVVIKKKAPPTYLGKGCGLDVASLGFKPSADYAAKGKTCELCHVLWDAKKQCLRQGCTVACTYDEDCPQGMVCLCAAAVGSQMKQICAAATDREDVQGRSAGLECPDQATDGGSAATDAGLPEDAAHD